MVVPTEISYRKSLSLTVSASARNEGGGLYSESDSDEGEDSFLTRTDAKDHGKSEDDRGGYLWGFDSAKLSLALARNQTEFIRIRRSKLMLDDSAHTKELWDELLFNLHMLKKRGTIGKDEDVIADFLTQLFKHTKKQLVATHGYSDSACVQHILCVPNMWSARALRRMRPGGPTNGSPC